MRTLKESSKAYDQCSFELDKCQKILLQSLMDVEANPRVEVGPNNMYILSDKAIVLEKLSIGKTLSMIALIDETKDDPVLTDVAPYSGFWFSSCTYQCTHHLVCTLQQIDMKKIPWTIYISDSKGINDAIKLTEQHTSLKYIVISNASDLTSMKDLIIKDDHSDINIVFIKYKQIRDSSTIREFKIISEGIKYKRIVFDNFDSIKFTYNDPLLTADFSWFICKQFRKSNGIIKNNPSGSLEKFIKDDYYNNPILQVCKDENIQRFFTIKFDPVYLKRQFELPLVKSFNIAIEYKNRIFKFQNTLCDSITSLINEDKIMEASQKMNIVCNSKNELYNIILDDNKEEYNKISTCIKEIHKILNDVDISDQKQNNKYVKGIYSILECKKRVPQKIKSENLILFCKKLQNDLLTRQKELSIGFDRLCHNVKDYECQCCYVPFDDLDNNVFLLQCCQTVLCIDCIFMNRSKLINKCPRCNYVFKVIKNDIITDINYLNFDIPNTNFVTTDLNINIEYFTNANIDSKLKTLLEIVKNTKLSTAKKTIDDNLRWYYKDIDNFGILDKPCNPDDYKVLVYTGKKSYDGLLKEMKFHNMSIQVECNYKNITDGKCITSVVFYDSISNSEKQNVINKLQVIGRQYNLTIYRFNKL